MSLRRVASELKSRLFQSAGSRARARHRYLLNERGAVAIYFALSAVVFVGVAGLAVDAARGYLVKARLSEAIDAAALAGGKALQTSSNNTKVIADATAFFNANFPNGAMGATVANPTINIDSNATSVSVASTATIPTSLMRVLGFQNMTMGANATAARAATGLDVVFSFDVSGSMCVPCTKIQALQSNAKALVDSLAKPFTTGLQQQLVTVNGTQYSLLNIGVVPWNSKVNVKNNSDVQSGTTTTATSQTVPTFTNPVTGASQSKIYTANTSEVPLLQNPTTIPGGWTGCVYARYVDDGNMTNDADLTLGSVTTGNKTWPAWDPIPNNEGEPVSGSYFYSDRSGFHFGNKNCYESDWSQGQNSPWDSTNGKLPTWWQNGYHRTGDEECTTCPNVGILKLQSDTSAVKSMIDTLSAGGATNAPQGLFWAWEVLMPGQPFDEAVVNPPFQRAQAIVFMTDGLSEGQTGDSYRGEFGDGPPIATTTSKGNITLPDGTSVKNNMNDRLIALAEKIKGTNPTDPSAVHIYVIQYTQSDPTLSAVLQQVATQPSAPYYFYAPDEASLTDIFNQIAASLSALRLVQ